MQTYRLIVDAHGRVAIPGAKPGQTVTVQIDPPAAPAVNAEGLLMRDDGEVLTLRTARTDEERERVIAHARSLAREIRNELKDQLPIDHGELYGEDGLPA